MARKTSLIPQARTKYYADWEGKPRANDRWVVEDAIKHPDHMFNMVTRPDNLFTCKVCGDGRLRREFPTHVEEHARQLGLSTEKTAPPEPTKPRPAWAKDVEVTILDALKEKSEGMKFNVSLADLRSKLSACIIDFVSERDCGDAPWCADCS